MIDVLDIVEKQKPYPIAVASPDDFICREVGTVDSSLLVSDPTISLYCFDHAARRTLFVQVSEGVDITAGPFLYMAQYEHAERLLAVPYEVFDRVAAGIELRAPLVFIHTTGRAGSTLLSKAFGELEAVTSLSEPDVYSQAVGMRSAGVNDDEIRELLTSATKMLFNPEFTGASSLKVVKFRGFCIEIADLLAAAFPDAGNLFLYRDLAASIRSRARAFAALDRPPEVRRTILARQATMVPLLAEEMKQRPELDGIEGLCLLWLSALHTYARLRQQGIPMLAVRYEELVADPTCALGVILAYLGLPTNRVPNALRAFERDSQTGSPISREEVGQRTIRINDHQWNLVRDLVRRYPLAGADIPVASVIVP